VYRCTGVSPLSKEGTTPDPVRKARRAVQPVQGRHAKRVISRWPDSLTFLNAGEAIRHANSWGLHTQAGQPFHVGSLFLSAGMARATRVRIRVRVEPRWRALGLERPYGLSGGDFAVLVAFAGLVLTAAANWQGGAGGEHVESDRRPA
jgi:hypothetical protein